MDDQNKAYDLQKARFDREVVTNLEALRKEAQRHALWQAALEDEWVKSSIASVYRRKEVLLVTPSAYRNLETGSKAIATMRQSLEKHYRIITPGTAPLLNTDQITVYEALQREHAEHGQHDVYLIEFQMVAVALLPDPFTQYVLVTDEAEVVQLAVRHEETLSVIDSPRLALLMADDCTLEPQTATTAYAALREWRRIHEQCQLTPAFGVTQREISAVQDHYWLRRHRERHHSIELYQEALGVARKAS